MCILVISLDPPAGLHFHRTSIPASAQQTHHPARVFIERAAYRRLRVPDRVAWPGRCGGTELSSDQGASAHFVS